MAKAAPIQGLDPQAPVTQNARLIVQARLDDLYRLEHYVDSPYSIRALHDLRIAAKRLRYTFEVFEEVLPAGCASFVAELTQLQDELGALHDSDVLIALLRLSLANQDSDVISVTGHAAHSGHLASRPGKTLVAADLVERLLEPSTAPTVEQRFGLEQFLKRQEHLRETQYATFRQHWYRLKSRDFRGEILTTLDA